MAVHVEFGARQQAVALPNILRQHERAIVQCGSFAAAGIADQQQARGGCLPIRARHDYAPVRERPGDIAQRIRRQTWNQVPGNDGPAATTEAPTQPGRRPPCQQRRAVSGTHVRPLQL